MRIRAKLQLSTLAALIVGVFIILAMLLTNSQVSRMVGESSAHGRLVQSVFGLDKVLDDYLVYPDSLRIQDQWRRVHGSLGELLKEMETKNGGSHSIAPLLESYERLGPLMEQLAASRGDKEGGFRHPEQSQILTDQLSVNLASMVSHASKALQQNQGRIIQAQQRASNITTFLMIALIVTNGMIFFLLARKLTGSVLELHKGTRTIGSGDLSHRIAAESSDEIGELGQAFNEMASRLGSSYAAMEAEILQRKKVEDALRESRERYAQAEQVARFGHWDWNFATNELAWSEETYRIFEVGPKEFKPTYESFLSLLHPDDGELLRSAVETSITHGKPFDIEYRIMSADGKGKLIHAVAELRLDEKDRAVGMFGTSHDITVQKEAEEKIKATVKKLEQSNKALDDFASIASHDMQEPLRKIIAFGDQLKIRCADGLGDTGRDYLERMQKAAKRMQTLLQALLDYSRISSKAEPFSPVDLNELVGDVIDDLEVRVIRTGGSVKVDKLPTLDAAPHQMRQLFQNLIGNALKFHREEEKPVVRIYSRPAKDGRSREILVEDNGIGFDEKHLDTIFAPFHRLHGRSTYEGTGMGLAICKKIVERHGGSITANSKPGIGSIFILTLPVTRRGGFNR